jgi:hypothetical protein
MTNVHTIEVLAGYWVFSSFVGGMPQPTPTSNFFYQWAYTSLHLLAGNLKDAFTAKFPQQVGTTVTETQMKETTITPPKN